MSELSDDHIDNLQSKFKAGERVTAKVLKVSPVFKIKHCQVHVSRQKDKWRDCFNLFVCTSICLCVFALGWIGVQ